MIITIVKKLRLVFIFFLLTLSANAQKVAENASQWYNWTEDDTRHYIYEMGKENPKDKTVVVIHGGWGAEHSYLIEPLEPLTDEYRFILYDQRGSLRTPAAEKSITLERLVEDLEDLRKTLNLQQMNLMAHSAGNHLAYAYLSKYPEKVNSLTLLAPLLPASFGNKAQQQLLDEVWPEADMKELVKATQTWKQNAFEKAKKTAKEENLLPDSLKKVPAQKIDIYNIGTDKQRTLAWRIFFTAVNSGSTDNWKKMRGGHIFYDQTVAKAITSHKSYLRYSEKFWPALKSFDGKVNVLIGTDDFVDIGPAIWPNVVDDLADGDITVIEGAGHSIWMTDFKKFEMELRNILSDIK